MAAPVAIGPATTRMRGPDAAGGSVKSAVVRMVADFTVSRGVQTSTRAYQNESIGFRKSH